MTFQRHITINARLTVLAFFALAFVSMGAYAIDPETHEQHPTPAIQYHAIYTVDLGESITVEFGVNAFGVSGPVWHDVDEVRVRMRPVGINTVLTYGYAEIERSEEESVGKTINSYFNSTYKLPTASPRYYPPGTQFEVTFQLLSGGEVVEEIPYYHGLVENLDEDRNWRRHGDEQLEIIYYGVSDFEIRRLFDETIRNMERISPALGVEQHHQLRAVVFPNIRELTRYGPTISQTAADGAFFGGFAYSRYYLTVMASPSVPILTHELTHLLHDIALDSPSLARLPAWLTEGIATYFETGVRETLPRNIIRGRNRNDIRRFREMATVPGRAEDIGVFYRQSGDFVGYLAELQGDSSIGQLLAEIRDGARLDDALVTVYNGDLDDLERAWRAQHGLPTVGVQSTAQSEIERNFPPTMVGVPTPILGGENRLDDRYVTERGGSAERVEPVARAATPTRDERIQPQGRTPTAVETPGGYVTSPVGREFRANPTLILVFGLLALGFGALFIRRLRS